MFSARLQSASRLLSQPSPRLRAAAPRRFFRDSRRNRYRARTPLIVAISVCTIGAVGLVGLAVDRYGPQGLAPFKTPFETVKSHLQKIISRTLHADPVETIESTPQPHAWDPNPGRNSEDEAEHHEQMLHERLHIREVFKRARASGSQEELRRACFSVIPFMGHESDELEVLGPLAPLPSNSRFTGKGALFDMATETRVYRELQPDGALVGVFVAVNADFDRLNGIAAFTQLTEAFINQMKIWRQESSVLINPNRSLPVAFIIQEYTTLLSYAPIPKMLSLDAAWSWCEESEEEIRVRKAR